MKSLEQLNKEVVLRFNHEVLAKGSLEALYEIVHPNFINHTAVPGINNGLQGIVDFTVNGLHKALTDIRIDIHDQVAEGNKVVTRKTIRGTHVGPFMGIAASGQEVGIDIIDIIALLDGRYMEHWSIRDASDITAKSAAVKK